jgi:choline-sulfatase
MFLDVYQGQRAVQWLQETPADSPWHLFVSFSGPHAPHDPPREYYGRYVGTPMPDPVPAAEDVRSRHYLAAVDRRMGPTDAEMIQESRRAYCAYIELIDEQVGHILEAVEARGEQDNTYVLFSSDHGEMLGDLGLWAKCQPYEPSIHVPLIVAGPDIPQGQTSEGLIEFIDLNPTICELAGLPPQPYIHARSFLPSAVEPGRPHRPDIVSAMRRWWLIRTDRYKLVQHWNDDDELYDLHDDPGERRNCMAQMRKEQPELVNDLLQRINRRFTPNPYAEHRT